MPEMFGTKLLLESQVVNPQSGEMRTFGPVVRAARQTRPCMWILGIDSEVPMQNRG